MIRKNFPFSNNVRSAGYDPVGRVLEIQYKSRYGRPAEIYRYSDVPQAVYDGLASSNRPGTYIADNIKGKFEYVKVPHVTAPCTKPADTSTMADPFLEAR